MTPSPAGPVAESETNPADLAIQKAAMAMGSTDEWTDQESMIGDFEERFAALRQSAASAREKALGEAIKVADDTLRSLKGAALILIDAVEHVRHAGGMGFDGKRFDEQIKIARAALGGSNPDRGEGK